MPKNTFYEYLAFVNSDGLYISNNHPLNPNFSEDVLSFTLFELVKNG